MFLGNLNPLLHNVSTLCNKGLTEISVAKDRLIRLHKMLFIFTLTPSYLFLLLSFSLYKLYITLYVHMYIFIYMIHDT